MKFDPVRFRRYSARHLAKVPIYGFFGIIAIRFVISAPKLPLLLLCLLIPVSGWAIRIGLMKRNQSAGRWLHAPVAEVDKSTLGNLLANRMKRNPGLNVVVRGASTPMNPAALDQLYDYELDGWPGGVMERRSEKTGVESVDFPFEFGDCDNCR